MELNSGLADFSWKAACRLMALALIAAVGASCANVSQTPKSGPPEGNAPVAAGPAEATRAERLLRESQDAAARGAWDRAVRLASASDELYQHSNDQRGRMRALAQLGTAYEALGHYDQAIASFSNAEQIAEKMHDAHRTIALNSAIGAVFTLRRQFSNAQAQFTTALQAARKLHDPRAQAGILNNLGNLCSDESGTIERKLKTPEGDIERDKPQADALEDKALASYRDSAATAQQAGDAVLAGKALTNAAVSAERAGRDAEARRLNAEAIAQLVGLPDSHEKAFGLITVGRTDQKLLARDPKSDELAARAQHSYAAATRVARNIGDVLAASYAQGYRASFCEQTGKPGEAIELARHASFEAQKAGSNDALYRWQWQIGRLLSRDPDQLNDAISAYRLAVNSLQQVRSDVALGYGNGDTRLTFRDEVGQLYYQYADLLLRRAQQRQIAADPRRIDLVDARDTIEKFKSGELEDYFQDQCVNQITRSRDIDDVGPGTAVVYIIPLEDRTELLVSYPLSAPSSANVKGLGLKPYIVPVSRERFEEEVDDFRRLLERRATYRFLNDARVLYDQLIRPIESDLQSRHIDTLVFVPDGKLRTIPMAALNDGDKFLVEKYAIAITPGLQLMEPHKLDRRNVRLLANGLSVSRQGYDALPGVPQELASIHSQFGGTELLNQQFELPMVKAQIEDNPYSIVHIASHGVFSSNAADTFVLTYDDKLHLNDLERLIQPKRFSGQPVELLCLSACQTAAGDDRAALGLAGVAIKAGARSAVASLWFVNDQVSAKLIAEFYRQLAQHPDISKAQALRNAQLMVLTDPAYEDYRHPIFWAPYLVIGNWL